MKRDYLGELIGRLEKIHELPLYWKLRNRNVIKLFEKEYPEIQTILNENKKYKDSQKGKRCFVIGNGPSLNDIDFKMLESELVVTVNRLTMHPDFEKLKSDYHFIIDLESFGMRYKKGDRLHSGFAKHSMEQIRSLKDKGAPKLIVPAQVKQVIEKNGLDKELCVKYFVNGYGKFIDGFKSGDFAKPVPGFNTVVAYAILWAAYLGVKEIYLLGCDQTILKDVLDVAAGRHIVQDHAYRGEEKLHEEGYKQYIKERGIMTYLEGEIQTQKTFKQLYLWCRSKKIKLYNLSSVTLIEGIPRKRFEDVISG